MAQPASSRKDGESIFLTLRSEILSGLHPPGTPMREVNLAERFGVSRTPVREALSRLQQERLLERVARGLQVPQVDPQQVIQVYDMRILLEEEAAGQAARARRFTDQMRLEALLERDRSLQDPDDQTRIKTNLEFHSAVWACAHNPVLQDLLERLSTHLVHAPHSTLSVGQRWEDALEEHAALVDAIDREDADTARTIARNHMATARALRLQLLREGALKEQLRSYQN
ncbi:GntR family transcriptional regulator [Arthrobacter koreensis]|uniref:GntR family transcriptional regulator n=1 Tax=Arthrobacter koreensis TaxID=199136 RepID=UPI0012643E45|nr:GntR family transcriptional regulator [Arthrobacter koreensis]